MVASESAINATTGGTLIPIITLGIPGGFTDAILLAALMIHSLQPGPLFFATNSAIVNTIMAAHLVSHVVMYLVMIIASVWIIKLVDIPKRYVAVFILVLCVIGTYSLNNRTSDVWVMFAFGGIGVALEYVRVPLAPFAIGLILGPLAEGQFRSALMWFDGNLAPLYERPITLGFLVVSAVLFLWPIWRERRLARGSGDHEM